MTDAELAALEAAAKTATPGPWTIDAKNCDFVIRVADGLDIAEAQRISNSNNDSCYIAAANPSTVLALIAELRQARKERDWVIQNIRPTDVGPTACPTKEIWYNCDEGLKTPRNKDVCHKCWLDAAKEATCQK